jgi:hypothetical protein
VAAGHEHVSRLHVAVEHVMGVRVVECRRDPPEQWQARRHPQTAALRQEVAKRAVAEIRHHVVRALGCVARLVQRHDVGMLKAGDVAHFREEAADADTAHRLGRDHLDRHHAAQLHVARQVHGPHAALAQLAIENVAAGDRVLERRIGGTGPRLDHEQLVRRDAKRLHEELPRARGRIGVLAVHDIGPVAAREPQLHGPVVLAQVAPREQGEQAVAVEAKAHWQPARAVWVAG